MKLQDIFDQLSVGEFSQLSIGGAAAGVIDSSNYEKLLPHISLGLTALYKRFNLREGRVVVRLLTGKTDYKLLPDYSVHSTKVPEASRFILDSVGDRFMGDVLKVEQVETAAGRELGLNDGNDCYSVKTPSMTSLRVPKDFVTVGAELPDAYKTDTLTVVYRANHPTMSKASAICEPSRVEIELPYSHLEALLYFIASRVHNPIGMTNEFHAGNSYYAKYEAACMDLENQGLQVDRGRSNTRAGRNGWV